MPATPRSVERTSERRQPPVDLLKVSAYDRASSWLISALVLVGLAVTLLFVLWLTTRVFMVAPPPEVFLVEEEAGTQNPEGSARDIYEPGVEDLQDLTEPDVQDTLKAVTDAVSSVAASLDALDGVMSTRGQGAGDNRKRGSGDLIPRWQRWEIRFENTSTDAYAKQLEFFGIELAAFGGGQEGIDYAYFDGGQLRTRSAGSGQDDDRIYFIWQGGQLKQQDRSLLSRAGVNTTGRVICQFYPKELENQLAVLEQQRLSGRTINDIQRTVFQVVPDGRGYRFEVADIVFRR